MTIYQELINFDKAIRELKDTPVIINDIVDSTEEEREKLKNSIYTRYDTDLLSNLPSCECGEIKGEFSIGVHCSLCNTKVVSNMEIDIEPILWMRSPRGVSKLINPIVWTMLIDRFSPSGFKIIMWICDTKYNPQINTPSALIAVQEAGIQRGYNYFVENFDSIIDILFNLKCFVRKNEKDYLYELIKKSRDCIFSDYLPLPNKALLVIEDSNYGLYTDEITPGAIDAIETIASIDSAMSVHSVRTKENRTVKTIAKLADFYDMFYKTCLSGKGGIFRKHVMGSRSHFSFRAVISSITDVHEYDEIHIPWGVATSVLRVHVIGKLLKRGMLVNDAIGFLNAHSDKYSLLLDEIFKELIDESPKKGIYCVTQRNPSLMRGSAQLTRITKVKTDPQIPTVSISILIVVSLNADFDGKKYYCRRLLNKKTLFNKLNPFNCWKSLRAK